MNASHAINETYSDRKSGNEQLSCDGTLVFQSASPSDYHHKVIHTLRTTERGTLTFLRAAFFPCTICLISHYTAFCRGSKNRFVKIQWYHWSILSSVFCPCAIFCSLHIVTYYLHIII